jgi:hypothetical protein
MVNHQISHVKLVSLLRNIDRLMVFEQDDLVNLLLKKLISSYCLQSFSIHQDIQIHNEIQH